MGRVWMGILVVGVFMLVEVAGAGLRVVPPPEVFDLCDRRLNERDLRSRGPNCLMEEKQ